MYTKGALKNFTSRIISLDECTTNTKKDFKEIKIRHLIFHSTQLTSLSINRLTGSQVLVGVFLYHFDLKQK